MTKRLKLRAALSLLLVLFSMPSAWAEAQYISGTSGPMWEYDSSTQTLTISGEGDMPDFTSPINTPWWDYKSSILRIVVKDGITTIGKCAFQNYTNLEAISIPSTVINIHQSAFAYCSKLTSLNLPERLQTIGNSAFNGCAIESVTIPGSVDNIGNSAFADNSALKDLNINDGVKVIGINSFRRCTGLKSLSLPNSITSINNSAFEDCINLKLKSITLPNSLQSIGYRAFANCSSLEEIIIPASVNFIDEEVFCACSSLASISVDTNNTIYDSRGNCNAIIQTSKNTLIIGCKNTTIPADVSVIGSCAFAGCANLMSIIIPQNVSKIRQRAFSACGNLTSITIPSSSSLSEIELEAFSGCPITTINIPSSVANLDCAFDYCYEITDVFCYYSGSLDFYYYDIFGSDSFKPNKATMFHVAANDKTTWEAKFPNANVTFVGDLENVEKLKYAVGEANSVAISVSESDLSAVSGEIVIPSSYTDGTNSYDVTAIAEDAFANCTNLTAVSIPSTITSIGSGAFAGCSSLNNIVVDANNAKYDSRDNCNAIIETASNSLISGCKNTVIPSSVTSIGSKAFSGCGDLSSITIPSGVATIGSGAFSGCAGLSSITIPSGVTEINASTFAGCSSLASVSLPTNISAIGNNAFDGCSSLSSITLPTGLTSIAKGAFKGTGLTTIEIPYSVKSVGESSFEGCSGLKSVTLPTDLAMIAKNTFLNCSSMTTVNIPVAVTKIEEGAFKNCDKLVAVTLPSGLVELGMSVFENSGLESITLPPEVTAIAQKAFYSCRNLVSATLYAPQLTSYADDAFDDNATNRKISVLSDYVDTYKSNWSKYSNDIVPISLTLNANPKNTTEKWCTYYNAAANVTVPAGVTIYKAQLDQANAKVLLSEVGGSIIAKGNAVMLKGSTSSINLSSAASAGSGDYTGNDLKGGTATPSTVAYTLAGINDVMGFYQFTGESLDPNKAHLEVAASNARSFIGFDSGTSTGVKLQPAADSSDQEWYTIDGRKLKGQPTQKGIYVKNGKKHVVK